MIIIFRFEDPWIWIILAIFVLLNSGFVVLTFYQRRRVQRYWNQVNFGSFLPFEISHRNYFIKMILLSLVGAVILICLTRPQMGEQTLKAKRKGLDIVVAIDTSLSMMAQDIYPTRLQKAKQEVALLIKKMKEDRMALVVFAGKAFVQCPLTSDRSMTKMLLSLVDFESVSMKGTSLSEAIDISCKAFDKDSNVSKAIILITDGEDHEGLAIKKAEWAAKKNIRIYTVGLGKEAGSPIPILDSSGNLISYKKDDNGSVVMSKVDDNILKKISKITKGAFLRGTEGSWSLKSIYEKISQLEKKDMESRLVITHEDRYQYCLWIVFILLFLESIILVRRKTREKI
ncbi:hypothetical protein AB834_06190 [PVC group bacterium (ex Bugula neritina AB1)]|nr:hypothetical protein AB834_06190 [PVC group bacterium (ex Bugula neritina AB1)]